MRTSVLGTALLGLFLLLAGCSGPEDAPLVVWSNTTDAAFFVERYNLQSEQPVYFRYVENLTAALTQERAETDVVVGRWVHTPVVDKLIVPVERVFSPSGGAADDEAHLRSIPDHILTRADPWIPLAFTLPTIVSSREHTHISDPFSVSLASLSNDLLPREGALEDAPPVHAPRSRSDGIYAIYRSLGYSVTIDAENRPIRRRGALEAGIKIVTSWTEEHYGSLEEEETYIEEFLYDPPLRWIETNRIRSIYQSSDDLFDWGFFEDQDLQFRWLSAPDGRIAVNEDVVYGGILATSRKKEAGRRFLQWLAAEETQIELVTAKIEARIDTFGLFGGFSTIPAVNETLTTTVYPRLIGRVPAPMVLLFPEKHRRYWNEAVEAEVIPFLMDPTEARSLETALDRWYLQRGD